MGVLSELCAAATEHDQQRARFRLKQAQDDGLIPSKLSPRDEHAWLVLLSNIDENNRWRSIADNTSRH